MEKKFMPRVAAGLACTLLASLAFAQVDAPPTPAGAATSYQAGMPEKVAENGVSHVCGGIGVDESTLMKQRAHDYDLQLTFATQGGNFLADVAVTITDAKGSPVLETTCAAPILLVKLAKGGNYKILAKAAGKTLTSSATIGATRKTKTIALLWPRTDAPASQ